ncbi:MAG: ArsA-related P-loop ATPase [Dehalococcoidia bacterium]|nr:ArsA-related P-loop ATPase [Dehalococcoidia bacterium]
MSTRPSLWTVRLRETLRLLSFSEMLRWWMDKVLPWERRAATVMRPLAKRLLDMPFPDDGVFESTQELFRNLDELSTTFADPDVVSVRLVVNPEKMVIKEAQRTHTYLSLYGYSTDMVVCSRVIHAEVSDGYFQSWKAAQSKYLQAVGEGFAPVPIRTVPLLPEEVVGIPMLRQWPIYFIGRMTLSRSFIGSRPSAWSGGTGPFTWIALCPSPQGNLLA